MLITRLVQEIKAPLEKPLEDGFRLILELPNNTFVKTREQTWYYLNAKGKISYEFSLREEDASFFKILKTQTNDVLALCTDGTIRLFDPKNGSLLRKFEQGCNEVFEKDSKNGIVYDILLLRDGTFASISDDQTICIWDMNQETPRMFLDISEGLSKNPDDDFIILLGETKEGNIVYTNVIKNNGFYLLNLRKIKQEGETTRKGALIELDVKRHVTQFHFDINKKLSSMGFKNPQNAVALQILETGAYLYNLEDRFVSYQQKTKKITAFEKVPIKNGMFREIELKNGIIAALFGSEDSSENPDLYYWDQRGILLGKTPLEDPVDYTLIELENGNLCVCGKNESIRIYELIYRFFILFFFFFYLFFFLFFLFLSLS